MPVSAAIARACGLTTGAGLCTNRQQPASRAVRRKPVILQPISQKVDRQQEADEGERMENTTELKGSGANVYGPQPITRRPANAGQTAVTQISVVSGEGRVSWTLPGRHAILGATFGFVICTFRL